MEITYVKHINRNNKKIEFLLKNFDFIDGGDYLARLFMEMFGAKIEKKEEYIYFSKINIHLEDDVYELLWHEDVGNLVYVLKQDEGSLELLEHRLQIVLAELNKRIKM